MADAGVAPADAVVVDDNPEVLQWAGRVGARTALVGTAAYPDGHGALGIKSLAELPPLLERLSQYLDRIEQV
jgi:FMN phosphatase YigB (HAD superfamily)